MKTKTEQIIDYVRKRFEKEGSGHDWEHTRRVWEMAKRLQRIEGGDLEIIEIAALLHCTGERDLKKIPDEKMRSLTMEGLLDTLDISPEEKERIITIIQEGRYKGDQTVASKTIEGKIVQDATWLDNLGAVGVARGFSAGGYLSRVIHDPKIKPLTRLDKKTFQRHKVEGTSINYFYEKCLQLPRLINTPTAKKIAVARLRYLENFLQTFMLEWDGTDAENALKATEPVEFYVPQADQRLV